MTARINLLETEVALLKAAANREQNGKIKIFAANLCVHYWDKIYQIQWIKFADKAMTTIEVSSLHDTQPR